MFDKATYDQEYHRQNLTQKKINFNRQNDEDRQLLEHLDKQNNVSMYIKGLIREDIDKTKR
jgi:hypothetical protein